ncbi:MAG: LysR family transcriptional regulator [Rhodospirillales bacterium]|nr:LysR family transcriptional regulator [Rhodospirillales bacterium]
MRLTLAQLEAFLWAVELGSVQAAARQLHLAQPTVSLRLRDLENALGVEVFERAGRGIRPTASGLGLLARAKTVLREIDRIREPPGAAAPVAGAARVGFAEGAAMVILAPLVQALRAEHPHLRPEFTVATTAALEPDLARHNLDLAVLVNPVGHTGVRLIPLGLQPTSFMAAPSWGLSGKVRPADLRNVPIVSNPPPSAMFRQTQDWFAAAGIEPARIDMCSSVTVSAHLIASGVAVGVLPHKMVERQIADGALVVLATDPPVGDGRVYIAYREGGESRAIDAIIHCLRGVLSSMDYLVTA